MLPFSKRVIYRMPAGVKEDSMSENNNIVKGYCFGTAEDAETARQEEKKLNIWNSIWIWEKRRTCS